MKNIFNIVKKELDKIFRSPRLIFSTFILPGLLIFAMYSFMGASATRQNDQNFTHEYNIGIYGGTSETLDKIISNMAYDDNNKYKVNIKKFDQIDENNQESYMTTTIKDKDIDLWILIDDNTEKVLNKEVVGNANIQLFSHTSNSFSTYISEIVYGSMIGYQSVINEPNKYLVTPVIMDLSTDAEKSSTFLSMLAPMLIMTFIFAGALSIGADSIAGEKERGTIATILMAPISKNDIVFGKIISTIIITVISALCSFIGLLAALTQLSTVVGEMSMTVNLGIGTSLQLLVLILLISLIAVSLFLIASTYAKTTKEATMYAMPVYIIGIISGAFTMYETSLASSFLPYIIPIYNLTLGLKGCFMNQLTLLHFLTIVGSNIVYFVIIIFIVRKMFNSEKIMFSR